MHMAIVIIIIHMIMKQLAGKKGQSTLIINCKLLINSFIFNFWQGESMVLETWCLGVNDRVDPNAKITYTVYNRIGMLLKSLVSVTRVTPAYQLSRKQGADFVMCYK